MNDPVLTICLRAVHLTRAAAEQLNGLVAKPSVLDFMRLHINATNCLEYRKALGNHHAPSMEDYEPIVAFTCGRADGAAWAPLSQYRRTYVAGLQMQLRTDGVHRLKTWDNV
ncbi:MAG TPA: hypothetical protein VHK27_10120 [Gammaproteobacteria bacterium]|nr:hypothetical protein [Gammaproteobacteria bacterium]